MLNISFQTISLATLQIFLTGSVGYVLGKKNILREDGLKLLSTLLVRVFLPCLIFSEFIATFSFSKYPYWWIFPLLSLTVTLVGFLVGQVVSSLVKNIRAKNEFLALTSFQNAGYIPLVITVQVFSGDQANQLYMYIFLFLIGMNISMWSLGVSLITGKGKFVFKLRDVLNPPMLATIFSLFIIFINVHRFIPDLVTSSIDMFGVCALPIAVLVVGGNLAAMSVKVKVYKKEVFWAVITKVVLIPIVALGIVFALKLKGLIGFLIMLQAVVPSATTLVVIAKYFDAEEKFISKAILYGHLAGLLTMPIFLTIYIEMTKVF